MVEALGHGRYRLIVDGHHTTAYAVADGGRTWVFIAGRTWVFHDQGRDEAQVSGLADDLALTAPMPATVLEVMVMPGQTVETGDVLLRLEAMKMEVPIAAPRAGVVTAIACRAGDLVQPGVPLVELD